MAGGWFKTYAPGTPVRLVANIEENNRIRNILNDIQGIGCRIVKPRDANGLGWKIVVDGGTDLDPIPDSDVGNDTDQIPYKPYDLLSSLGGVPPGGCVWWPYDIATYPIPQGWEEATEMRRRYPVGDDPSDTAYPSGGATLGYESHGGGVNDHATHNLAHSHTLAAPFLQPVVDTYLIPSDTGFCSAFALASGSTVLCSDTNPGGITWCDTGGAAAANSHTATDNRPPSLVGVWIRRLPWPPA